MRIGLAMSALVSSPLVLASNITLDGQLNDVQWQNATVYQGFYQVVPATLQQSRNKVEGRTFTTEEGIYIGFKNLQKQGERKKQYNLQDAFMQANIKIAIC